MQITYIAIKAFTYAGRDYQRGDVWEPQGFRNDDAMISGRFVVAREEPTEPILADVLNNTPARRGRRVSA